MDSLVLTYHEGSVASWVPVADETADVSPGGDVRDWICLEIAIAGHQQGKDPLGECGQHSNRMTPSVGAELWRGVSANGLGWWCNSSR